MPDVVTHGYHVAHVVYGENGVEHPALAAVLCIYDRMARKSQQRFRLTEEANDSIEKASIASIVTDL